MRRRVNVDANGRTGMPSQLPMPCPCGSNFWASIQERHAHVHTRFHGLTLRPVDHPWLLTGQSMLFGGIIQSLSNWQWSAMTLAMATKDVHR